MKRRGFLALSAVAVSGCGGLIPLVNRPAPSVPSMGSMTDIPDKVKLLQEVIGSPDLPAWHEQREQMALAVGDRTFNRTFDRVFDSMTVALSTMGSRVQNMERTSGYIAGSIPNLGPIKTDALHREGLRQYAVAKGYKRSVAEASGNGLDIDASMTSSMMTRDMAGLTISILRQSKTQTKVKLRFDNVYFPVLVSEYYKMVWAAVDKQMFLDQSLD